MNKKLLTLIYIVSLGVLLCLDWIFIPQFYSNSSVQPDHYENGSNNGEPTVEYAGILIAAYNSDEKFQRQADFFCDGDNDQVEIQRALNSAPVGETIVLSSGTFFINSAITIPKGKNLVFKGAGEDSTILNFTPGLAPTTRFTIWGDAILEDYQITGSGWHQILGSNVIVRRVKAYNIDDSAGSGFAAFNIYLDGAGYGTLLIENITFDRCKAIDIGRTGFLNLGYPSKEGAYPTLRNVTYTNCQAINCGRYVRGDDFAVGFNIAEQSLIVENITYTNCLAEGNWQDGWHCEFSPSYRDVRLINCTSSNNAQKGWENMDKTDYGAGYFASGDIYFENCISEHNRYGWYLRTADDGFGALHLQNCSDVGSQYGLYIRNVFGRQGLQVNSCTLTDEQTDSKGNGGIPIYFTGIQNNVSLSGLEIVWTKGGQKSGAAILIDHAVVNPEGILIKNSMISDYSIGIDNEGGDQKINLENVTIINANLNLVNLVNWSDLRF